MRTLLTLGLLATVVFFRLALAEPAADAQTYWPQWRGPYGTGVAPHGRPPLEWSEDRNVRWKTEIPGKGYGTPIVWGSRIYLTTAVSAGQPNPSAEDGDSPSVSAHGRRGRNILPNEKLRFTVLAIDRVDGDLAWQTTVREATPHEGTHPDGSWASASAVTDGQHVYAFFGSNGLYALDTEGRVVWERDFGDMSTRRGFGEGSSPALHGDTLVVNWDHEGQSFITALDKRTGETVWKVDRDEITSWSTPMIVDHRGRAQVVTSATNRVRSYDLRTGDLLWETSGMTVNTIPTPVAAEGRVYVTSGFRGSALLAIHLDDARGDITETGSIAWKYDRDTPYVPSPLLYEDTLYFLKSNSGILSCFDPTTGEPHYTRQRLDSIDNVYASPVGAGGRVYITGREGTTLVLERGPSYRVLASNSVDDRVDASMAVVEDEIYLRGHRKLYCISDR